MIYLKCLHCSITLNADATVLKSVKETVIWTMC